jgi:RNA polymerase sigma-70 factor (ECF subfamily)
MDPCELKSVQKALIDRIERLRSFVENKTPRRFKRLFSADDILQEVWISANPAFHALRDKSSEEVDKWLTTIASRKLIDALRVARALKRGDGKRFADDNARRMTSFSEIFTRLAGPDHSPSREFRANEQAHSVGISLAALTPDRRRVIELRFVDGLSLREIARVLDRSEAAVHSLLFNALRQLRGLLGDAKRYLSV